MPVISCLLRRKFGNCSAYCGDCYPRALAEDAYGTISEPDSCFGKKKPTFPFVHNITDPVESICIYIKFIEDFDCHVG